MPAIALKAFDGCTRLESIVIPASVENIYGDAFASCNALTSVYYGGDSDDWESLYIAYGNAPLIDAALYFYSESEPEINKGDYWYWNDGEPTLWS